MNIFIKMARLPEPWSTISAVLSGIIAAAALLAFKYYLRIR